jgi:hypothetical protein
LAFDTISCDPTMDGFAVSDTLLAELAVISDFYNLLLFLESHLVLIYINRIEIILIHAWDR